MLCQRDNTDEVWHHGLYYAQSWQIRGKCIVRYDTTPAYTADMYVKC